MQPSCQMATHEGWFMLRGCILYCTLVFLSLHRLSKKPGDNKAKKSKQVSQKYTAARLHEKGVLISIDDLQPNQWVLLLLMQKQGSKFKACIFHKHQ